MVSHFTPTSTLELPPSQSARVKSGVQTTAVRSPEGNYSSGRQILPCADTTTKSSAGTSGNLIPIKE